MKKQYAHIKMITLGLVVAAGLCWLGHVADQALIAQTSQNGPTPPGTSAGTNPSPTNAPGIPLGYPQQPFYALIYWVDGSSVIDGVDYRSGGNSNWFVNGSLEAGYTVKATNSLMVPATPTGGTNYALSGTAKLTSGVATINCTNLTATDLIELTPFILSNSAAWIAPMYVSNLIAGQSFQVVSVSNGVYVTTANYSNSFNWLVVHTQ